MPLQPTDAHMRDRNTANYRGRGRGRNNGGRGTTYSGNDGHNTRSGHTSYHQYNQQSGSYHPSQQNYQSSSTIVCQICQKPNHSAMECYHRMNFAYMPQQPSPKLQAMIANRNSHNSASSSSSTPWILDSGATNHVTADLNSLSNYSDYYGSDRLAVGNGNSLPIEHTGSWHEQDPIDRFT